MISVLSAIEIAVPRYSLYDTDAVLIWVYILVAGAPPSAIRAGVVATFVLAAPLFGRQVAPVHCTN